MKIIYSISYKEILLKWRFHGKKKNLDNNNTIFFKPALKFKKLRHDLWYGRAGGETDQRTTMTMRCASGWTARTTTTKQQPVYYSLSMLSLASLGVGRCLGCNVPTNFLFWVRTLEESILEMSVCWCSTRYKCTQFLFTRAQLAEWQFYSHES